MNLVYVLFTVFLLIGYKEYRGEVVSQILDGNLVPYIEYHNYIVGLQYNREWNWRYISCVGSIVSPWKVVTAAHCVHNRTSFTIVFGTVDLNYRYFTLDVNGEDIISHPAYSGGRPFKNDIAVLRLNTRIPFDTKVEKIDMVDEGYIPREGDLVTMLGYTQSLESGKKRNTLKSPLREINSTVESFYKCQDSYSDLNQQRQFCVKLRSGRHNTNQGDSGGPVLTSDRKFIGVTSFDRDDEPEVFTLSTTRVSGYRDWIANPTEYSGSSSGLIYETDGCKFIAAILYQKYTSSGTCGAVVLSNNKILTSAHCVSDQPLSVTLLLATSNTDEPYKSLNVVTDEIFIHPEYSSGDSPPFVNDIAIILLKKALKFGLKIGKIDMVPTSYMAKPGEDVELFGYSESQRTHGASYYDTNLRSINTKIADFDLCLSSYAGTANLERGKQLCLVLNNGEQSTGRFSGGPIITKTKKLLGIVSHSMNGLPLVVSSVTGHRKFIDNPRGFRPSSSGGRQNVEYTSVPGGQTGRSIGSNVPSRQVSRSSSQTTTESDLVRKIEDHKYTAGLLYKDDSSGGRNLCTVTIITSTKVLTAAHCVHNKYSVTLELGTLDTDKQYKTVNVSKEEILVHPQYSADPCFVNDIAVILLKKALKFDSKIGKIDMVDKKYVINTDDKVTLYGHSKGYLRYFDSKIADFVGCRRSYWEKNNDNPWLEENRQFCVRDGEETSIGTGYSGGPVVTAGKKLIGIFSYDKDGLLLEICTSIIGHRSFIDNPKLFITSNRGSGNSGGTAGQPSRTSGQTGTGGQTGASRRTSGQTANTGSLVDKIEGYKYMAAIFYTREGSSSQSVCSATIISNYKILAPGHCLHLVQPVTLILSSKNLDEPQQTVSIPPELIVIHPEYNTNTLLNNLAMIQLKAMLKFGSKMGKCEMATSTYKVKDDEEVTIVGYSGNRLHIANATISNFEACKMSYSQISDDSPMLVEKKHFCIRFNDEEHSSNERYIGSTIINKNKKVIGIISFNGLDGLPHVCSSTTNSGYHDFIANPRIYAMNHRKKYGSKKDIDSEEEELEYLLEHQTAGESEDPFIN
ncbi:uncharacterized protein LOC116347270 [Contarinia nasturtii]|uniref:uncharacterized protein LOC116347270 n=1 Tax=Contarinia nasturtii TaxID=265458 RepID=UPI0012D477FF|nr:uncharacterized protein LOC116347270 [Contarinia nasturtii]